MGQIQFPPGGINHGQIVYVSTCFAYGEDVTINFAAPGMFSWTNPGAFTTDLPMGYFPAPSSVGKLYAVNHDATVILNFFDPASGKLYVETVTIKSSCP